MAYNHLTTIKDKAKSLSALTSSASDFITANILNVATREFKKVLGDSDAYDDYMTYMESEAYDSTKLVSAMTSEENQIDALVASETYFALSSLAYALRKMNKNTVFVEKEEFGSGILDPVTFDEIANNAEYWRKKAADEIVNSGASGSTKPSGFFYASI